MTVAPEMWPGASGGIAEVSQGAGNGAQAFWVTCEFRSATQRHLCRNDYYLEDRAEHVLSHHAQECIPSAVEEAIGTSAAHDNEPAPLYSLWASGGGYRHRVRKPESTAPLGQDHPTLSRVQRRLQGRP